MGKRFAPRFLALLAFLALVVASTPGTAQAPAQPAGVLSLASQTMWWQTGAPFSLALGVQSTAPETLEVAVTVFGKLANRTSFAGTLAGRVAGRAVDDPTVVALADLPTDDRGDRVVSFIPTLRDDGVYPLRVELRPLGGGPAVAGFVTHLVHVPTERKADELAVATIIPAHAPPAVQPDGNVAIDDGRAVLLADLAEGLGASDVGLTFAPTPETMEALAASPRDADRATLSSLVRELGGRQLVGGPFVPTNLTAVIDAGLEEESAGQLTRGTDALRARFSVDPTTSTRLVDERLSDAALAHLQGPQLVTRVVVPEALLQPVVRNTTLTASFGIESRRGAVEAAVADAALAAHFSGPDPVLAAHRLLADLAVIYNDDPGVSRRGVVVAPARTWEPSSAFLRTFLAGLSSSPILDGVDIDTFFEGVAPAMTGTGTRAAPLIRRMGDPPPGAPGSGALPGATISAKRRQLEAFASAVDPASVAGQTVLDRLDRTLLAAQSSDLRGRDRERYLDGVDAQLDEEIAGIAMPQDRSITLTAREGEIPVTITNRLGYPMRVVLRIASDSLKFPDGATHDLDLVRENTTSQFTVQAQSSGSFRTRVTIESPEGLVLAESDFTVRSTAVSGVGTALSIGAGLFLVVWWANHLRGRRSKRLVPGA